MHQEIMKSSSEVGPYIIFIMTWLEKNQLLSFLFNKYREREKKKMLEVGQKSLKKCRKISWVEIVHLGHLPEAHKHHFWLKMR